MLLVVVAVTGLGCSSNPPDEPAPKGTLPTIEQAKPGMQTPEERARGANGGGEGS